MFELIIVAVNQSALYWFSPWNIFTWKCCHITFDVHMVMRFSVKRVFVQYLEGAYFWIPVVDVGRQQALPSPRVVLVGKLARPQLDVQNTVSWQDGPAAVHRHTWEKREKLISKYVHMYTLKKQPDAQPCVPHNRLLLLNQQRQRHIRHETWHMKDRQTDRNHMALLLSGTIIPAQYEVNMNRDVMYCMRMCVGVQTRDTQPEHTVPIVEDLL